MTAIVHQTPTVLDVRAITTMGISAKPNSDNPIGQFGTGLKYAIAVLVRHGAKPVVCIGQDRHIFSTKAMDFRGKAFEMVRMRREKWSLTRATYHDLPFTTEYGRFWLMWMAFRELESNTRDEGGITYRVDDVGDVVMHPDHTHIIIECPDYIAAWEARDEVFLPEGRRIAEKSELVQVVDGAAKSLYFRSLRALDTKKPTLHTYNFLSADIALTEDRTIKSEYTARSHLAQHVVGSNDEAFIERVITSTSDSWEHGLDMPSWVRPSAAFQAVVARRPEHMWSGVIGYVSGFNPPPRRTTRTAWELAERPWYVENEDGATSIYDAGNRVIFTRPPVEDYAGDWHALAEQLVRKVNALSRDAHVPF